MAKKAYLPVDSNQKPLGVIKLNDSQTVNGSVASAQSTALDGRVVRIVATTGPLYFLIGTNPTAAATSHYLADQGEIYQPCAVGDKIAIYGGIANIATCGE